ncbi:MAG: DUF4886 domain-containing protein [Verrucomicrobiales bacterium]
MSRYCLILVLLLSLIRTSAGAEPKVAAPLQVLFIGNSYSFNVPGMFAKIARSMGKPVAVEQVTKGGWTLAKHAASPETRKMIASRNWDFIILQEQSQIPSSRDAEARMVPAAEQLHELATESGAELVYFETWGRRDGDVRNVKGDTFEEMQKRLTRGYGATRDATGGRLVPVGQVWGELRRKEFWAEDGSHPSKSGAYLAACVFYSFLVGASPEGADYRSSLDAGLAKELQQGAWKRAELEPESKKS